MIRRNGSRLLLRVTNFCRVGLDNEHVDQKQEPDFLFFAKRGKLEVVLIHSLQERIPDAVEYLGVLLKRLDQLYIRLS